MVDQGQFRVLWEGLEVSEVALNRNLQGDTETFEVLARCVAIIRQWEAERRSHLTVDQVLAMVEDQVRFLRMLEDGARLELLLPIETELTTLVQSLELRVLTNQSEAQSELNRINERRRRRISDLEKVNQQISDLKHCLHKDITTEQRRQGLLSILHGYENERMDVIEAIDANAERKAGCLQILELKGRIRHVVTGPLLEPLIKVTREQMVALDKEVWKGIRKDVKTPSSCVYDSARCTFEISEGDSPFRF